MSAEYNALIKNDTWTLVPQPTDANIARLVANVNTKVEGIDVDETFSPVAKLCTIWTVLSLATSPYWPVLQLDVKNAFLHAVSLWAEAGPSGMISVAFSMTGLGSLNYFLGISVTRDSLGIFLSQRKYVVEILERGHMVNCNPSRTPVDTESKLGMMSVKNLVFRGYANYEDEFGNDADIIEINAPYLLSLAIQKHLFLWMLILLNVSSLVKANLDYDMSEQEAKEEVHKDFLLSLRNVKDLIIGDSCEKGAKMQATVRMKLVPTFKQQLNEGDAVVLRMYSLGQTQPVYRVVPNPLKLNFVSKTQLSQYVDFKGSVHGFVFKHFKYILQSQTEAMGIFFLDVIGQVIESPKLDNHGGNEMGWSASMVLFEKDMKGLLNGASAYQLLAIQERNGKLDELSSDFNHILDHKYAFKISMDYWRSKNKITILDRPENALILMITPSKDQTSDATIKDTNVSELVLESVTDDNGTTSDLLKSITSTPNNINLPNKRNGDGVLGDEGSNIKRQKLDKMGEKNITHYKDLYA
nr:hypothetical protein [Tanacetum cinerariifolium]